MEIVSLDTVFGVRDTREQVKNRLAKHQETLRLVRHPVQGMGAKGFSEVEISAAVGQLDTLIDFCLDLLEDM